MRLTSWPLLRGILQVSLSGGVADLTRVVAAKNGTSLPLVSNDGSAGDPASALSFVLAFSKPSHPHCQVSALLSY